MLNPSIRTALLSLTLFALAPSRLRAQSVPTTINYQGRLTDNSPSQAPINATANMTFEIWDVPSGGTAGTNRLWIEPASGTASVVVTNGIFNVLLGASAGGSSVPIPASVFSGGTSRYLQIIVNGETLTPRQTISATGYANQAQNAALAANATNATTATNSTQLGGVASGSWQRSLTVTSCSPGQFYNAIAQNGTAGCATVQSTLAPPVNLSANLASPTAVLSASNGADGPAISAASTSGVGIIVTGGGSEGVKATATAIIGGVGVRGIGNTGVSGEGSGTGVFGSSTNGTGVYGISTNSTGVYGTSTSGFAGNFEATTNGTAVLINNGGASGVALQASTGGSGQAINAISATGTGITVSAGGPNGLYAITSSAGGNGVYGVANNGALAFGVQGSSTDGVGVAGSSGGTGQAGLFQITNPANSSPALSATTSGSGRGIYVSSASGTGITVSAGGTDGIYAVTTAAGGNGVHAIANNGTGAYGVWGESTNGYAGYFSGKVNVTGSIIQPQTASGAVKAMAFVNNAGAIIRCYNGGLAGGPISIVPCGMSVSHPATGQYNIDFGFKVDNRFISVSLGTSAVGAIARYLANGANSYTVIMNRFNSVTSSYESTDGDSMVFIY